MNFKYRFVKGKTLAALTLAMASITTATGLSPASAQEAGAKTQSSVSLGGDPELATAIFNHFKKRFLNRIEATSEQRDKINNILENKIKENRQTRLALKNGMKELSRMACDPKAKISDIEARAEELQTMRTALAQSRLKAVLEVRALLTEEQLLKLGKRLECVLEQRRQAFES